jgi:hypothetical protein
VSERASSTPPGPRRVLLAKLVICTSMLVALATSAPPIWITEDEQRRWVYLDAVREQKLLVTVELGGELYADVQDGAVGLTLYADRAASDLTLVGRALTAIALSPDEEPDVSIARPTLEAPNEARLGFEIECAERDPSGERPESCIEQFEFTLARESERPLNAYVHVGVRIAGEQEQQPPGTFQVRVEELPP